MKARIILGKKRTKHFSPMVKYLRTKSVMPTAQIRSKKSKLLRLGLANMRLEEEDKTWLLSSLAPVFSYEDERLTNQNNTKMKCEKNLETRTTKE